MRRRLAAVAFVAGALMVVPAFPTHAATPASTTARYAGCVNVLQLQVCVPSPFPSSS